MEIVVGQDFAPSRMDAHSIAAIDAADMLEEKRDLNWFLAGQVDPVMPGHKPLPDLSRKLPVVDAENLQGGTDTLLANLRNPPIRFEVLSDTLDASSQRYLKHLAKMLVKHPSIRALIIEGHTDNQNRLGTNLPLSEKRAQAVKRMLEQQGVAGSKLIAIGYGHSQPVADNETAEGRARNRRIVFKLDAAP
ncbi:MAG: OmpA family protein [Thiobacillus sp.]